MTPALVIALCISVALNVALVQALRFLRARAARAEKSQAAAEASTLDRTRRLAELYRERDKVEKLLLLEKRAKLSVVDEQAEAEALASIRQAMGLDKPTDKERGLTDERT